ncbi:hypothetical protein SteCoe_26194 [Stentor coeruleus]|uniref:Uncharacterized protein n=1 Tax=Stentor coeruleus TaxID=5963 RepID=A0A1R2BDX6_9CILI|nr:hypothetical protein SteCoe_26194 [Stentor coeruleus]
MSLPPISPSSKFSFPIKLREPNSSRFKTSLNIKILNPLIPIKSKIKRQIIGSTINKAHQIIPSIPPIPLKNSKYILSRLSQMSPIIKPTQKKTNTYLKKKYIDFLEEGRNSDFSVDFTKPIRDYFQETTGNQKNVDFSVDFTKPIRDYFQETTGNQKNALYNIHEATKKDIKDARKDIKIVPPQVYIEENKTNISKYASLVMPFPNGTEKRMITKDSRRFSESEKDKNKNALAKYVNQSLQTDANSFEFDDWEFDYDA